MGLELGVRVRVLGVGVRVRVGLGVRVGVGLGVRCGVGLGVMVGARCRVGCTLQGACGV